MPPTTSRLRPMRATLAMLVATLLAVATATTSPATTLGNDGKPITNAAGVTFGVLAHRAGGAEWPQNSAEAYTRSVAAGVDAIETDIVFTKDGHGVMSHNETLPSRCTSTGRAIHTMTLAEVQEVRCANLAGDKVVPIPTFDELADILDGHPEVELMLEVKSYAGQSAKGRRAWTTKAIGLVKDHGLLAQTSFLTFFWDTTLPTIRSLAPDSYVLALDLSVVDYGRVRKAADLGADAFGLRMAYTTVALAEYVKAKGMDSTPWQVETDQQRAFSIHYGGQRQLLSSDVPTVTQQQLVDGEIDLDPTPAPTATKLAKAVTIRSGAFTANRKQYRTVGTSAVPATALPGLQDVTLAITVKGGTGKGTLSVGASSSPLASSVTTPLPKGTATVTVKAPLGKDRKLRIFTTRSVSLTVKVTGYTRMLFT
ncbi:MAG: glycerophosphodiester phosphodiesterase family protein [Propionicimonas sp.]|uniref:glycerophosphodiester phosphodiesterase n=1 Tax=Propionicimonas sp. TaxID=1955623 RepID=UPI003D10A94E